MTDTELTLQLQRKNEAALGALQAKYGSYCHHIAENILHNREDAEECVADALQQVWQTVPPQKPEHIKYYFARLTRNAAINYYHAQHCAKRGGGETALVLEELENCISSPDSPEKEFAAKELSSAVNRFLGTLPARERDIFLRRYFFVEPLERIAHGFGMRKQSVSVLLYRTREKCKSYLKKEGYLSEY